MDHLRKKKKRGNKEIPEDQKKKKKPHKNHIMIQNLWDTAKAVLRRKFIAIQVYLKKKKNLK